MSIFTEATQTTPTQEENSGFQKNTHVQDAHLENYDLYYIKSKETRNRVVHSNKTLQSKKDYIPTTSDRYNLILNLDEVKKNINLMLDSFQNRDLLNLASNGIELLNNLEKCWKLRKVRSEEWGTLLNFLQSALSTYEFEKYSKKQIIAIKKAVDDYLYRGALKETDIERVLDIFEEANLDPWKGISNK